MGYDYTKNMDSSMSKYPKVEVTDDCVDEETGIHFYKGDLHYSVFGVKSALKHGLEVKIAGHYAWIPADKLREVT